MLYDQIIELIINWSFKCSVIEGMRLAYIIIIIIDVHTSS